MDNQCRLVGLIVVNVEHVIETLHVVAEDLAFVDTGNASSPYPLLFLMP